MFKMAVNNVQNGWTIKSIISWNETNEIYSTIRFISIQECCTEIYMVQDSNILFEELNRSQSNYSMVVTCCRPDRGLRKIDTRVGRSRLEQTVQVQAARSRLGKPMETRADWGRMTDWLGCGQAIKTHAGRNSSRQFKIRIDRVKLEQADQDSDRPIETQTGRSSLEEADQDSDRPIESRTGQSSLEEADQDLDRPIETRTGHLRLRQASHDSDKPIETRTGRSRLG